MGIEKRVHPFDGFYVDVDGPDAGGKGMIIAEWAKAAEAAGLGKAFNCDKFEAENKFLPQSRWDPAKVEKITPDNRAAFVPLDYRVLIASEPSYRDSGVRNENAQKMDPAYLEENPWEYHDTMSLMESLSADRRRKLPRVILPVLKKGGLALISRAITATWGHQWCQAKMAGEDFTLDMMLSLPGNQYAMRYLPNLLVIPTKVTSAQLMERLDARDEDEDDNHSFETEEFQAMAIKRYASEEYRSLFGGAGVEIIEIDTSGTEEYTREQAREIFDRYIAKGIQPHMFDKST